MYPPLHESHAPRIPDTRVISVLTQSERAQPLSDAASSLMIKKRLPDLENVSSPPGIICFTNPRYKSCPHSLREYEDAFYASKLKSSNMKRLSTNFYISNIKKNPSFSKSNLPTESTAPEGCGLFPNDQKKLHGPENVSSPPGIPRSKNSIYKNHLIPHSI
ncbi:hypothetical protein CDAR_580661 [Caerostris darwini]|uniref:Uncharacterized protein n=1 Tax=Caerostris darwini TaxID=1538125 RepID=A0AAV4TWC4_9ARAC|nr:hypothetical protein CDAR_580661 [Caerostris darwini]